MKLPEFKYHPDPLKSGSIVPSDNECECCGAKRGFIYTGPVYAEEELVDCICPWCISSGKAHEMYDDEFTDYDGIGDHGTWDDSEQEENEIVAFRTPGFAGWQQERWWTHCSKPAAFLGIAGDRELSNYGESLITNLKAEAKMNSDQWTHYRAALDKNGSPTAYVFRCTVCTEFGGYSDCD